MYVDLTHELKIIQGVVVEVLRAVNIYCCDHYGGMLWDLQGTMAMASQYYNSWKTCVKLAWRVPR